MPIEIRELVIKTSVNENSASAKTGQLNATQLAKLKKELLENCVERVLAEIKQEKER